MAKEYYRINVAGLERDLPICPINEKLMIAGFVIIGDPELTCTAARELLAKAPEHDVIITAETKGIPLAQEMARQAGRGRYILARKSVKLYMKNVLRVDVKSITTASIQTMFVDGSDAEYMKGKKVLIVDDVISTGESLRAIEQLVTASGGDIVGRMAILAEGDAIGRTDITYLAPLPLFDSEGEPI